MTLTVTSTWEKDGHYWCTVEGRCDAKNLADDALVKETAESVRRAYGQDHIMRQAQALSVDAGVRQWFNTSELEDILNGFKKGLPDPSVEDKGKKPPALRSYRSEAIEMVAKTALSLAFKFEFPTDPQIGKSNANQPILGFDHWGLLKVEDTQYALILVQVKGTQDSDSPPGVCKDLVAECQRVQSQSAELARALSLLVIAVEGSSLAAPCLTMLAKLGRDELPRLVVAPVVVRGLGTVSKDDLSSLESNAATYAPATACGAAASLPVDLNDFGRAVMNKARAA